MQLGHRLCLCDCLWSQMTCGDVAAMLIPRGKQGCFESKQAGRQAGSLS